MRVFLKQNVLDAALARIRWLFDEFQHVVVSVSGGKDSTVVFNLAMQVAREKGRLPLKVLFLDQEAEWEATIENIRLMMHNPDVEPLWYQIPIKLFNATSTTDHWLQCWDEKERHRWMREQEDISIKENTFGTDRFVEAFSAIMKQSFKGESACYIAGVRAEESPSRALGLTNGNTYKGETWGKQLGQGKYTMYPIYDWSYTDVWKAIHDHGWPYNSVYDAMYAIGVPVRKMRVSNVHHETAVESLFILQDIEPQTYARLTQRISGIDMAGKMGTADYFVRKLPYMFSSWTEYREFLLERLIDNPDWRKRFRAMFDLQDAQYGEALGDKIRRVHITSILTNDWEGIKMANFNAGPIAYNIRKKAKAAKALEQPNVSA